MSEDKALQILKKYYKWFKIVWMHLDWTWGVKNIYNLISISRKKKRTFSFYWIEQINNNNNNILPFIGSIWSTFPSLNIILNININSGKKKRKKKKL